MPDESALRGDVDAKGTARESRGGVAESTRENVADGTPDGRTGGEKKRKRDVREFGENDREVLSRREGVRFREFVRQCGEIRVAFTIRCDHFKSRRGFAARRIRRSELRFNEFSKVRMFHR